MSSRNADLGVEPELQKIIGEISYRPTLKTWKNTLDAAQKLEERYDDWGLKKEGDIQLVTKSEKKILHVTYNSIVYINESKIDTDELQKHLLTIHDEAVKGTEIKEFRHIGVRQILLFKTKFKLQELVEILYEKFYLKNEKLKSISGEKIDGVAFIQDGIKNDLNNRIHIAPLDTKQAEDIFKQHFVFNKDTSDSPKGECYLFIDIDVFLDKGFNSSKIPELLVNIVKENKRISEEYNSYIREI